MSTQNQFSFNAYAAACVAASQVHNGRQSKPAAEKKRRGRKSLWETDYDAAVKRQWERVMKDLPKSPMRRLRAVPVKLEVVALLTQQGEVVERYVGMVIPNIPKRRGRKSLWETDPEAAAAREMEKWEPKALKEPKKAKALKEPEAPKEPKKRGRKSLWETDYDAAVKRQHKLVMKELCPRSNKSRSAAMQAAAMKRKLVAEEAAKELVRMRDENKDLRAQLDALRRS